MFMSMSFILKFTQKPLTMQEVLRVYYLYASIRFWRRGQRLKKLMSRYCIAHKYMSKNCLIQRIAESEKVKQSCSALFHITTPIAERERGYYLK